MDKKKVIQTSDLVKLITEKIEFLKNVGVRTQNSSEKRMRRFK